MKQLKKLRVIEEINHLVNSSSIEKKYKVTWKVKATGMNRNN
jgi:hypothetical protein